MLPLLDTWETAVGESRMIVEAGHDRVRTDSCCGGQTPRIELVQIGRSKCWTGARHRAPTLFDWTGRADLSRAGASKGASKGASTSLASARRTSEPDPFDVMTEFR